jgi:Tol biopolymer transport system component
MTDTDRLRRHLEERARVATVEATPITSIVRRAKQRESRRRAGIGALGVAAVGGLGIGALWMSESNDAVRSVDSSPGNSTPPPTIEVASTTISNGWVAFAAGEPEAGIYLVREGRPANRVTGIEGDDGIEQGCPAFSPDGTRLAYGQAMGNEDVGYQDATLVIADLTAAGEVTTTATIAVDDITLPPCPTWSADGRWVAFGAGARNPAAEPAYVVEVWVVDAETSNVRKLSGLKVSDMEWAPDATELYIASDGIVVYSVATDQLRPLGDTSGVEAFTMSPDGESIVFQRRRPDDQVTVPTTSPEVLFPGPGPSGLDRDLWLMDADGRGERILVEGFSVAHGIGPVWSPDGNHIAYQRSCVVRNPPSSGYCREEQEVVVITVNDHDPLEPAGTEQVIPPWRTTATGAAQYWYPSSTTWSPDGTTLLILADPVVAVRLDGQTPPVVLYDGGEWKAGYPPLPIQNWSRMP